MQAIAEIMNEHFLNVVETPANIILPTRDLCTIRTPFELTPCTPNEIEKIYYTN